VIRSGLSYTIFREEICLLFPQVVGVTESGMIFFDMAAEVKSFDMKLFTTLFYF
jgi:hypothetical protein